MTLSSLPCLTPANPQLQIFSARSVLPLPLDSLWQIEAGFVRSITWLEDGTTVLLGIWGPGDVVGKLFSNTEPYQLECITKIEATLLPATSLNNSSETLLGHISQFEALMQIRSYKRVDLMVLKFLSWLGKRFGQDVTAGRMINLRLTHQDIADSIGATRVTVTRTLSQLEQQGMIQRLSLQRIVLREEELWHYEI